MSLAAGPDATLARDYESLKTAVLRAVRGKLAAAGVHADDADLDGFYNQAWHAMYLKLAAGEEIENRTGLLVSIAHRRALDEHRALHLERRAASADLEAHAVEPDLAAHLDDHLRIARLIEGMRDRLSRRELQAAALCYVHGYTRLEAAHALGIRPRRMDKLMDGVSRKLRTIVGDLEAGDWCDSRRSLIAAYALGLLDAGGQRYELAADHLRNCPACRHRVLAIRGLTAVTPPAPLIAGAVAGGGAATAGPRRPRRLRRRKSQAAAAGAAVAVVTAVVAAAQLADGTPPPPATTATDTRRPAAPRAKPAPSRAPEADRSRARRAQKPRSRRQKPRPRRIAQVATPVPAPTTAPQPEPAVQAATPAVTEPAATPAVTEPAPDPPLRDGWNEFELGGPSAGGP